MISRDSILHQHSNTIFWILFVLVAAHIVLGAVFTVYLTEILAGLILIIIGLHRIEIENKNRQFEEHNTRLHSTLMDTKSWLSANHHYTKSLKDAHESRLHKLDQKRGLTDKKLESSYRDLVRKIVDIENRLNEISRALSKQPTRSGRRKKAYKGTR